MTDNSTEINVKEGKNLILLRRGDYSQFIISKEEVTALREKLEKVELFQ